MKNEMVKVAEYKVERAAIYESSDSKGAEKILSVYYNEDKDRWAVQIGGGKLHAMGDISDHAEEYFGGFMIYSSKPQRWVKA